MSATKIEWTESTWNPVTGCTKISPGCLNCYAERMSYRLQAMGQENYQNGFSVSQHEGMLDMPLRWKKPRMIFVNSMSDLFHENIQTEFIMRVFDVMRKTPQHVFQVLTKRSSRLVDVASIITIPENAWIGVTVESSEYTYRIDHLREVKSSIRFLSLEPLLGPVPDMNLKGVDWAIVGGESGPGARPMHKAWVRDIRKQCSVSGTSFFFKQWGGVNKKKAGRILDGKTYNDFPLTTAFAR